ncbi:aspartyl-tRNA synthetase [Massariosphaeria phaeospora]|uniref:Aspartyl-tRNA synthetase n=1 Tax=Massariosphaeria phaeospora TaxID=100035 RepID=A0A7C8MFG3_9PLEO|nr:aspartyl-tRNA synthetase [Massariosphaeria phaeospora]
MNVTKHVACRGPRLRSTYAEISRFIRTRHHGITPGFAGGARAGIGACSFSSSPCRLQVQPDDRLRKSLDKFKATIMSETGGRETPYEDLLKTPIGTELRLTGYLGTRRDVSKKLSFALLKNREQTVCVQLISTAGESEVHTTLKSLREWTPVVVKGKIKERKPSKETFVSDMDLINNVEIELQSITPLNDIPPDLIIKEDTAFPPEQRHLQIRTDSELRRHILARHKIATTTRSNLYDRGWSEIETPILFKSTPEGAREFLVPTRTKGLAYALPQSPQQYKQILMASGIAKYFQFARCFRDEDLRADRQPEFTQLDMEMSFVGERSVMCEVEQLLQDIWREAGYVSPRFGTMTYKEAMTTYGSDKPDLRFETKIHQVTDRLPQDLISKITSLQDPIVDAFELNPADNNNPKETRKFISAFLDSPEGRPYLDNLDGQPGVFIGDESQPLQGLAALGHSFVLDTSAGPTEHGELLILQARKNEPLSGGSTMLGNLRLALHKAAIAQGLIETPPANEFRFVWITDFPLFSPTNDTDPGQGGTAGLTSTHHPFTAPKTAEDVELLLTAPEKAIAAHYDIVVNGVELGGGSRRIHNADVQEFVFRDVLKMKSERIEDFRHLLDALRSGCPPHAGIALGWDRLAAVLLGRESVRDVIAFPKSGRGEDMVVKSPNAMTEAQLDTYHLRLKE